MRGSERNRTRELAVACSAAGVVAVALVASVPGSPFHPVLADGAGPTGPFRAVADALGLDRASGGALVGFGLVAIALALAGFLLMLRETWRGGLGVGVVVGLAIAYHAVVLSLPLLFSRDVYSYAFYGDIAGVHGLNPYVVTPQGFPHGPLIALIGPKWLDTPSVYGPGFTLLSAGLGRLVRDVGAVVTVYRLLAAAASLATLLVVVRLSTRLRPERAAFAAAIIGVNPVVLFQSVGSGHNDLLVALAVAGALALVAWGRTALAAAVLALGTLVKATAALPLLLLIVWAISRRPPGQRFRAFAVHAGVAFAIGLGVAAPFLQTRDPSLGMVELATHQGWLAPSRFLARLLGGLGDLAGDELGRTISSGAVRAAFALALVVGVVLIARVVRRRAPVAGTAELGAWWGWVLLLSMLLGPVLLPWYVTWTLPLAWLLPRVPRATLIGVSAALTVSQFTAEPSRFPDAYDVNVLFGHYVVTPMVAALLVWLAVDLRRRLREGSPPAEDPGAVPAEAGQG